MFLEGKSMKIFKWVVGLIIVAFGLLVVLQNQEYFLTQHSFHINLFFVDFSTAGLHNIVLFAGCFFSGVLVIYFLNLGERFRSKKVINELNTACESRDCVIADLKNEMTMMKNPEPAQNEPDAQDKTPQENTG